jgi:hypothetical protein
MKAADKRSTSSEGFDVRAGDMSCERDTEEVNIVGRVIWAAKRL